MIATSSASVATASKDPAGNDSPGAYSRRHDTSGTSPATRVSASACKTCAFSITFASSPARSSGIVATTTPPASRIPNQHAISSGEFAPCRSTRLPGTSPPSPARVAATASARERSSA